MPIVRFQDICDEILNRHKGSDRPRTYIVTRTSVRHLLKTFTDRPIQTVSSSSFWAEHVPRARAESRDRNLNNDRKIFIQVLFIAYRRGLIPAPPSGITKPNAYREVGRELSDEEIRKLFLHASNTKILLQMELALKTGMRLREMLGLRWDFINFKTAVISLPGFVTKTRKGRFFPICRVLCMQLQYLHGKTRSPYVFPSNTNRMKPQNDNKHFWRIVKKKAGVECRWHDLRHTNATRQLRAGIPKERISKVLGMSEGVLISIYSHLNEEDLRPCATAVNLDFVKSA